MCISFVVIILYVMDNSQMITAVLTASVKITTTNVRPCKPSGAIRFNFIAKFHLSNIQSHEVNEKPTVSFSYKQKKEKNVFACSPASSKQCCD